MTPGSQEEKRETCCYAVQDKFWLADPDGNRWEISTELEDVEAPSAEAASGCTPDGGCATPTTA